MKKIFLLTTSALLLLVGCAKEMSDLAVENGLQEVTFTASMASDVATKAKDDGDGAAASVNRCIMEIYYDDSLFARQIQQVNNKQATFTCQMVSNRKYKVAFWADHVADASTEDGRATDLYYSTASLKTIAIMGTYSGNEDARDAFFHTDEYTINQAGTSCAATLYRPFAQVNVITTDWDKVTTISSLKPDSVDVTIQNPLTKFNAVTGVASADANVKSLNYKADLYTAPAPVEPVSATEKTLSMDYLFAATDKAVIDIAWKAQKTGNTDVTHSFTNIPYQRNYRTNIKGNLLTTQGQWDITVDPSWATSETDVKYASTLAQAQEIIQTSSTKALIVEVKQEAVTNATTSDVVEYGGKKYLQFILKTTSPNVVSFNLPAITTDDQARLGTDTWLVTYESGYPTTTVSVNVPAGTKMKIEAPTSHVEVTGTSYAEITASTGDNTLVIPVGTTVDSLIVNKGGLEIHGTVTAASIVTTGADKVYVRDCENLSEVVYTVLKQHLDVDNGYVGEKVAENNYNIHQKGENEKAVKIGDVKYYTVAAAFAAAQDGDKIELLKSCSISSTITVDKTVTLDLKTDTLYAACSDYLFNLNTTEVGKTFKIIGTDVDNCGHIASNGTSGHKGIANINGSSAITFEMDYVKVHGATEADAYVGTANNNKESLINDQTSVSDIINLNHCTIKTTSVILGGTQDHSAAASLNVTGGSYTGAKGFRYAGTDKSVIDGATITVDQGIALYPYSDTDLNNSFIYDNATGNLNHDAISIGGKGSELIITNTTVQTVSKTAVAAENLGKATIASGAFQSTCSSNGAVLRVNNTGGQIDVNGGTFDGSECVYAVFTNTKAKSEPDDPAGIYIYGGTFTGGSNGMASVSSDNATVEIGGGTFTTAVQLHISGSQWVKLMDNCTAEFQGKVTSSTTSAVTIPAGIFMKAIVSGDLKEGSTISGGTFYEAAPYSGYIKTGYEAKAQGTDPETWIIEEKGPEIINVSTIDELNGYLTTNLEKAGKYVYQLPADAKDFGTGTVSINQRQDVYITIQGVSGSTTLNQVKIEIAGHGRKGEDVVETVTIKDIAFDFSQASAAADIIASIVGSEPVDKGHTHNVTIEGCTFTGNPSLYGKEGFEVVAVRDNKGVDGWNGLSIKNCTATNLHSLAQLNKIENLTITGSTVTGCEGGVNISQSLGTATICDNNAWNVGGYCIRAGQSSGGSNSSTLMIYGNDFTTTSTSPSKTILVIRGDCPNNVTFCDNKLTSSSLSYFVYALSISADKYLYTDVDNSKISNNSGGHLKIVSGSWDKSTKTFKQSN